MANKNLFTKVQLQRPGKNVFDLTHDVKLSARMGRLTPVLAMECVPGDKIRLGCESIIRFSPMIAPVMHRMDVTFHYFFVPNRILWDNWETFITGSNLKTPAGSEPDPVPPTLNLGHINTAPDQLANYLGVPYLDNLVFREVNALPFAAYQCIYNEYYRDQNLIEEVPFKLTDGDNTSNGELAAFRRRAWEHDYFTSALPWAQKGPAVDIPLAPLADVPVKVQPPDDYPIGANWNTTSPTGGTIFTPTGTPDWADPGNQSTLYAETSLLDAEPTTINDLRRAFKLQEWLEKNARGGTRYVENILVHFGVKSSDARLQRPEYITGVKTPVIVSEVLNTTGETSGLPQGNMAGHGISVTTGKHGSYFCEEHGWIIGVMSVLPRTAYQQGIPRHFLKQDRLEYFWPTFAHLGEQEIQQQELYANSANPSDVFGYTPRYSEYKYMPSRVAGTFQTSLDFWHLGRKFDTDPALNSEFVEANPTDRIFAITDGGDNLYCHVLNTIKAVRPMPFYGTPSF